MFKKTTDAFVLDGVLGGIVEGAKPHYHVGYVDEISGMVLIAPGADGHEHPVEFIPEEVDPQSGAVVAQARVVIMPASDGHDHVGFVDYEPEQMSNSESDAEIAADVYRLFQDGYALEVESRQRAKLCEEYYRGDQWDSEIKKKLNSERRCALTHNLTEVNVDTLMGYHRQNRQDIRYLPIESGDQKVADILNYVSKYITERCGYHKEDTKIAEDQVVVGRGNIAVGMDFSDSIEGDAMIYREPWHERVYGPHEREDLRDCYYTVKHKMYTLSRIRMEFGDEAYEELKDSVFEPALTALGGDVSQVSQTDKIGTAADFLAARGFQQSMAVGALSERIVDIARKEVRVLECWRKVFKKRFSAVNTANGHVQGLLGWKKEDVEALELIQDVRVITAVMPHIRISIVAGGVVLSDEDPADIPWQDFNVAPVYAKKRENEFWSPTYRGLDSQDEINKRHSQSVDIGNKMSVYGHLIDSSTFADEQERRRFQDNANSPGGVYMISDTSNPPVIMEGVRFPSALVDLMRLSMDMHRTLFNINPEQLGANEPAELLQHKTRQALLGNEYLFDNQAFAKKRIGKLLIGLIQKYYTAARIYRILESQHKKEPVELGGQPFENFSKKDINRLLTSTDLAQYDVEVSEVAYSPSARLAIQSILSQLANAGLPGAMGMVIEMADIPETEKKKILGVMNQGNESQQQEQAAATRMEENKTLIAQGVVPPDVQARLQQDQAAMQGQQGPPAQPPVQ